MVNNKSRYTATVITISDTASKGNREDISGKVVEDILLENGFHILFKTIVSDDIGEIKNALCKSADEFNTQLVITTGGTGFSKRDNTPEATRAIIHREAQGIAEAIRYYSLQITPRAMLSRGVAGIRNESIIINLPGSPKAVKEGLNYIIESVKHGIDILLNKTNDCARES